MIAVIIIEITLLPFALFWDVWQYKQNKGKSKIMKIFSLIFSITTLIAVCSK